MSETVALPKPIAAMRDARPLRIASVPHNHVYVRHLSWIGDGVTRLPDPRPDAAADAERWWPPRMLDPEWVREHHESFEVFHLHFGFDACSPAQLAELTQTLTDLQKPLVYTVHDLRNPHHRDSTLHAQQLDVLIPAAAELITLTPGAAGEISRRYGRAASVLPHPYVVPEPWRSAARPAHDGFVVGIHAKSLRASMDPHTAICAVVNLRSELPGLRIRVDVHTDVVTPGMANHDPELSALVESLADAGRIDLRVHDYFTDDELWAYLSGLDASVLPYRFGTHSGWLEACHDLGTAVVAPDCGHIHEQRPCVVFEVRGEELDPRSLREAVRLAYHAGEAPRAAPHERDAERARLAAAHLELYRRAIALMGTP